MSGHADLFDEGLFPADMVEREPSVLLRDRYQEPPFSVLNRATAGWQKRDGMWKALGIQSELGREGGLTYNMTMDYARPDGRPIGNPDSTPSTSVFSPTLVELLLRWYSAPGDRILDPFAGGSVRGVVSSVLGRHYTGVELSGTQVEANRAQAGLGGPDATIPLWIEGDSTDLPFLVSDGFDMVLSCPPYAYLEEYSDDPRDLSSMDYPDFLAAYRGIIQSTVDAVADDRFIAWVVGEVRDKRGDGSLLGLVPDTIQAFRDAGARPYNDHILVTPVGTAAVRTPKQFDASRKAGRIHEYVLVFVKGNAKAATARLGSVQ